NDVPKSNEGSLMHPNLAVSLNRADELLKELVAEYQFALHKKEVTPRAKQITHEVCERLRSALDRLARLYWDRKIAPYISDDERKAALVYFPIASDQNSFDSILGRWRWKTVRNQHQEIYDFLRGHQPFVNNTNDWLQILSDLAVQGKHIDLVPQKRQEERRITATDPKGGSVSWGKDGLTLGKGASIGLGPGGSISFGPGGVRFSGSVSAMGAPIDPATQRVVPGMGVVDREEIWVSFKLEGYAVDAAEFCRQACTKTRQIAVEMTNKFGPS